MFEFRDLFQWDGFITPASTETAKRHHLVGPLEGGGLKPVVGRQ